MIALAVILAVIALLLIMPVGGDVSFIDNVFSLSIKAGPFKIDILPKKEKPEGQEAEKKKKPKKEKKKKDEGEAAEGSDEAKKEKKPKQKLTFEDIMGIIKLALDALGRFRRSLSIDVLMLHLTTAGPDPYSAVMNYGYFNAAIGAILPSLHRAFKVKKEDIASAVDFDAEKMKVDARLVLTIRIGEILLVVFCAAFAFLKWFLRRRRRIKREAKAAQKAAKAEEKNNNTDPEKGR